MIGVCSRLHLYERTKFKNTVSTEKCPLFWQLSSCNVVCHGHVPVWEAKFQVKPSNHCIKPRSQSSQQHHEINEIIASNRSNAGPACQKGGRKWHVAATQCRSKNETCKQLSNISKTQLPSLKKTFTQLMIDGCLQGIASDHDDGAPSPAKFPCKAYRKWQGSTFARTFKCLSGLMLAEFVWLQLQSLYHP